MTNFYIQNEASVEFNIIMDTHKSSIISTVLYDELMKVDYYNTTIFGILKCNNMKLFGNYMSYNLLSNCFIPTTPLYQSTGAGNFVDINNKIYLIDDNFRIYDTVQLYEPYNNIIKLFKVAFCNVAYDFPFPVMIGIFHIPIIDADIKFIGSIIQGIE